MKDRGELRQGQGEELHEGGAGLLGYIDRVNLGSRQIITLLILPFKD